jgi:hypothetical protein
LLFPPSLCPATEQQARRAPGARPPCAGRWRAQPSGRAAVSVSPVFSLQPSYRQTRTKHEATSHRSGGYPHASRRTRAQQAAREEGRPRALTVNRANTPMGRTTPSGVVAVPPGGRQRYVRAGRASIARARPALDCRAGQERSEIRIAGGQRCTRRCGRYMRGLRGHEKPGIGECGRSAERDKGGGRGRGSCVASTRRPRPSRRRGVACSASPAPSRTAKTS